MYAPSVEFAKTRANRVERIKSSIDILMSSQNWIIGNVPSLTKYNQNILRESQNIESFKLNYQTSTVSKKL